MKALVWLKPAIYGAAGGAAAIAILGFSWGGWMTENSAQKMASDQARMEVVSALVPICLDQSNRDPRVIETIASLKDAGSYQRSGMLMDAGWATMPGSSDPNHDVARACLAKLADQF